MSRELLSVGYATMDEIDGVKYKGGAAAGIAINAHNLGLQAGLFAVFGTDQSSREYSEYLDELGVDIQLCITSDSVQLPVNTISHVDRTQGWSDGGMTRFFEEQSSIPIDNKALGSYEIVHLTSAHYNLATQVALEAAELGCTISFSPGPKIALDNRYCNIDVLHVSDLLFVNNEEWLIMKGLLGIQNPTELFEYGPRLIAITRGEQGVLIAHSPESPVQEEFPVESMLNIEPTGAGDAFALGYLFGYHNQLIPTVCTRLGTALASLVLKQRGTIINIDNLKSFYHTHNTITL